MSRTPGRAPCVLPSQPGAAGWSARSFVASCQRIARSACVGGQGVRAAARGPGCMPLSTARRSAVASSRAVRSALHSIRRFWGGAVASSPPRPGGVGPPPGLRPGTAARRGRLCARAHARAGQQGRTAHPHPAILRPTKHAPTCNYPRTCSSCFRAVRQAKGQAPVVPPRGRLESPGLPGLKDTDTPYCRRTGARGRAALHRGPDHTTPSPALHAARKLHTVLRDCLKHRRVDRKSVV